MNTPHGVQGITEADIANYLANSPAFFERHAELLSTIQLTSPHGQRAVSLQERQMEMLRDKIRGLESRQIDMIRNGQDNVAIAERLHRWTRSLMRTPGAAELPEVLVTELRHEFLIPQVAIRIWGAADAFSDMPFAAPVSADARVLAASLALPYCGPNNGFEAVQWLSEPAQAVSVALLPLHYGDGAFGMLVLASPDPTRYTLDMGTEFLVRVADLASAALSRLLPVR